MDICLIVQKTLMQNYAYIIPPQVVPPLSVAQCKYTSAKCCTLVVHKPHQHNPYHPTFYYNIRHPIAIWSPRRDSMQYDIGIYGCIYTIYRFVYMPRVTAIQLNNMLLTIPNTTLNSINLFGSYSVLCIFQNPSAGVIQVVQANTYICTHKV